MYLARVFITLKPGVLDPQGNAVLKALHSLNFRETEDVRIGKYMEIKLAAADREAAAARMTEMCRQLLANPVIEDFTFELTEENP